MDIDIPDSVEPWLGEAGVALAALVLVFIVHRIVFAVLGRLARRASSRADALVRHTRRPALTIAVLLVLLVLLPGANLPEDAAAIASRGLSMLLTASIGWLAFSLTRIIDDVVATRYDVSLADNLEARIVHTRVRVLQQVLAVVIVAVTASVILMAIPGVRQIGITLFASAGVAGIVAGFAARPVLANLFAGLQLALTQPIRIDDVVIVEGEWGWIEEISTTFVVVRIWDLRRLIVPLSYFIENPFENWTRKTADILGSVILYADYTVPVEKVRRELQRIVEDSPLWDRKVCSLQVTDATEHALELRALMGAHNSSAAWDLRCQVREALVAFLQREHPETLPHLRAELVGDAAQREGRTSKG